MGWNTARSQKFDKRTIASGASTLYRMGDTFCPGAGWLLAWSASNSDELTLKVQIRVEGKGNIASTVISSADMSKHGLIAIPWPNLVLTVSCDNNNTDLSLHGYAIDQASQLAGWPSSLFGSSLQNITASNSSTVTIPAGATAWTVTSKEAFTASSQDKNANTYDAWATTTGTVTLGAVTPEGWRPTVDGGSVKVVNDGSGTEDFVFRFRYNLRVGSSLA